MVRPSKVQQFDIYQDADAGMSSAAEPSLGGALVPQHFVDSNDVFVSHAPKNEVDEYEDEDGQLSDDGTLGDVDEALDTTNMLPTDTEPEDVRRESAVTYTSVSSLPESSFETDQEHSLPMHEPYHPPMTRPSFRRRGSVRRMQMSSPTPFERSPRRQVLHSKSRTGTPRSVRSSAKGSPLSRKWREGEEEEEKKEYPLVLLHVTLLPVDLRWSAGSMQKILPVEVLDNLQLLRTKVSETIVQRGILIPHPRHEYDLLEERLLEALELKKERITKCGHFRARDSTSSISSAESSVRSSDSGLGSSVEGIDADTCITCHSRVKSVDTGVGIGKQKWSIKVFAANGLMRASAWAAAWSEMERVDVEILPWIDEEMRRQLDARLMEEDSELRQKEEEARIRGVVEEQVRIAHEERKRADAEQTRIHDEEEEIHKSMSEEAAGRYDVLESPSDPTTIPTELPNVYRTKEIPLSLLLKNYILLLAQDSRNLVIFGLSVFLLWMSMRAVYAAPTLDIAPVLADRGLVPEALVSQVSGALKGSSQASVSGMPELAELGVLPDNLSLPVEEIVPESSSNIDKAPAPAPANAVPKADSVLSDEKAATPPSGAAESSFAQDLAKFGWEDLVVEDRSASDRMRDEDQGVSRNPASLYALFGVVV